MKKQKTFARIFRKNKRGEAVVETNDPSFYIVKMPTSLKAKLPIHFSARFDQIEEEVQCTGSTERFTLQILGLASSKKEALGMLGKGFLQPAPQRN
jgi:hypothetical protein